MGTDVPVSVSSLLRPEVKAKLCATQRAALKRIDEEDFRLPSATAKRVGGMKSDEEIQELVTGLKMYYAATVLDPHNAHAFSPKIDWLFHGHMLCTKPFAIFCQQVFGAPLEHNPLDEESESAIAKLRDLYDYTTEIAFPALFKKADSHIWPKREDHLLVCSCDTIIPDGSMLAQNAMLLKRETVLTVVQ